MHAFQTGMMGNSTDQGVGAYGLRGLMTIFTAAARSTDLAILSIGVDLMSLGLDVNISE